MTVDVTHDEDFAVEWVGMHSAISLSRVLKRIACEERSGDLQVAFGDATKTIYLKEGLVVFAASTNLQDRLGEAMLQSGRISEREFLLASHMMRTEGRKFGEALVQMGLLTAKELERQLQLQFNRIVTSLFKVHEGIYSFEERPPAIPDELLVRIPIPYLLLDGLRSVSDKSLLLTCLPPPKQKLRATTRVYSDFDICDLDANEMAVLRAAKEGATIKSIVETCGADHSKLLRTCGALYIMGFLEPESTTLSDGDIGRRITNAYFETEDATDPQILGVLPSAEREQIDRAYILQRMEWTHVRQQVANEPSLESQVSEILFRIAAAYHHLVSEKQTPPIESFVANAPTDSPSPVVESDDEGNGTKDGKRPKEDVLRDAKLHIQARDWAGAIPLLFELVDFEPENATFRGLLAKAMFKHPVMRRNAERHFLEAIRLSPGNAELHTWLGLYYKSFGMGLRADAEFRAALEIDPNNRVARKQLSSGPNVTGHIQNPFRRIAAPH